MPQDWYLPPAALMAEVERRFPGMRGRLAEGLQAVGDDPHLEFTSYYRPYDPKRALTQHNVGLAFDVQGPMAAMRAARERILRAIPGLWAIIHLGRGKSPHLHVQSLPSGALARARFFEGLRIPLDPTPAGPWYRPPPR